MKTLKADRSLLLLVDVQEGVDLEMTEGIVSLGGDVDKVGAGRWNLHGGNPNWSGVLTVREGRMIVRDADALGSVA